MLPNHAPLHVAETFRVLEALHPGRVDLGLGRAPGTDPITTLALRRSREAMSADDFPVRLDELLGFLDGEFPENHPFERIRAMPDDVPRARNLAPRHQRLFRAARGACWACATPTRTTSCRKTPCTSLRIYNENFRPSRHLAAPESLLGMSVLCAETDERAAELARPMELTLLRFRSGKMGRFPTIAEATDYPYTPEERYVISRTASDSSPARRRASASTSPTSRTKAGVREIMITTMTHEHADRRRSYELLAEAFSLPRG